LSGLSLVQSRNGNDDEKEGGESKSSEGNSTILITKAPSLQCRNRQQHQITSASRGRLKPNKRGFLSGRITCARPALGVGKATISSAPMKADRISRLSQAGKARFVASQPYVHAHDMDLMPARLRSRVHGWRETGFLPEERLPLNHTHNQSPSATLRDVRLVGDATENNNALVAISCALGVHISKCTNEQKLP